MTKEELQTVLEQHKRWLQDSRTGKHANLGDADLRGANLNGANLGDANLSGANLRGADLRDANLIDANLRYANLNRANLRYASGLSINIKQGVLCEFKCGLSIEADIIYVGCKQHTILEWQSYISSGLDLYLDECSSKESHDKCVQTIEMLINIAESK